MAIMMMRRWVRMITTMTMTRRKTKRTTMQLLT